MLRNISPLLSPDLVYHLMRMGHGDEIVLGDANFPAHTLGPQVVRADGLKIPELLDAILQLMPLDSYNDWRVGLMQTLGDDPTPEVWSVYEQVTREHEDVWQPHFFERFAFYEQASKAAVVVLTGETALYGNIILKKGVL